MSARIRKQYRKGYYGDHGLGLGQELRWYPDETEIIVTREGGEMDRIRIESEQDTVRAIWHGHGHTRPLNLTRRTPWFRTHAEVVNYWTTRFIETFQLTDVQQSF